MGTFVAILFCVTLGGLIVQSIYAWSILRDVAKLIARGNAYLSVQEVQNKVRDAVADRVIGEVRDVKQVTQRAATCAAQARDAAAKAVEQVPEKVVGLLKSGDS